MMSKNLCEEFRHFEGQPVEIFTDDERMHCGIVVNAYEGAVRIIDACGRPTFLEYSHIDAVVEPQMRVRCCRKRHCCDRDNDRECEGRDDDDFGFEDEFGRERGHR